MSVSFPEHPVQSHLLVLGHTRPDWTRLIVYNKGRLARQDYTLLTCI